MTPSSIIYIWTILFSTWAFGSWAQTTNNRQTKEKQGAASVQSVDTSLISIIQFDNSTGWLFDKTYSPTTLNQSDIKKIELLLTNCVDDYNKKLSDNHKQYFSIDLIKKRYKRQYVAVVNKKGEKLVWVNCLCQTHNDNWRTSIILVDDGGNCYFNLKINLTKEKCYDLMVNGLG